MNFEITQNDGYVVLSSRVEKLDAIHAPELKTKLVELNKSGNNCFILDLSATRYCDSSGLSAILTANRLCKDSNGSFVLSGLQDNVSKMVKIAQLDKVLRIEETLESAKAALTA